MSNHTIHKISLKLPAPDYNQAREYQALAKHWANHSLPMLLNDYFEKINPEDELIYLDKIEIQLTDFPWKVTDEAWIKKMEAGIKIQTTPTETFTLVFKQWLFYLRNGCFENNAVLKTLRDSENYVFNNWNLVTERLMSELRQSNISPAFLNRLLFYHAPKNVALFFEKLLNISHHQAEKIIISFTAEANKNIDIVHQTILFLINLINQQSFTDKEIMVEKLIVEQGLRLGKEMIAKTVSEQNNIKKHKKESIEDVYITCSNAGLVLLFPYLKIFFEASSLISNNEFINDEARQIAAQATFFLATGKDVGDEEEFAIPKLLCGIEPNEFIRPDNILSDSIKTEANELLQAAIEHWKILQNTTAEGLRETFLQRNGRFIKKGEQYILQVEESGVDILLNNIPWGFRNYRLPWMPFTIITEWY